MQASDSMLAVTSPEAPPVLMPPAPPVPLNNARKPSKVDSAAAVKPAVSVPAEAAGSPGWSLLPLLTVPCWLVSLAVHLLLIVLLALITAPPQDIARSVILAASISTDEAPLVEVLDFVPQKLDAPQAITTNIAAADLSMVTVGDLGDAARTSMTAANDFDVAAGADIGEIFSGGGMQNSALPGVQGAEFFGVKATGRKFVFVVDSSISMRDGKFDAAKQELAYAIHRLSKDQFFYVIFFDRDAARMTFAPNAEPEEFIVPATNANVAKFEKWMATIEYGRRTDPSEAMKHAVEMSPDAIFILSDGKFTDGGRTVRYLAERNIIDDPVTGRIPRVVINTIAFWQNDGEEQMRSIAKDYGGTYRFVPRPKDAKLKNRVKMFTMPQF